MTGSGTAAKAPTKGSTNGAVAERPFQKLMAQLKSRASLDGGSSFDIAANVIDTIAQADSWDALVAANEAGPADMADYLNKALNVTDLTVFKSAEKFSANGLGAYVVLHGHDDNGEAFLLSTGAPNVVATLYRAQELGLITEAKPLRCSIKGRETANGTLYTVGKA